LHGPSDGGGHRDRSGDGAGERDRAGVLANDEHDPDPERALAQLSNETRNGL
jgi:hypothetical protein